MQLPKWNQNQVELTFYSLWIRVQGESERIKYGKRGICSVQVDTDFILILGDKYVTEWEIIIWDIGDAR